MRMPLLASLLSEAINIAITVAIINVMFYSLVLNPIWYVMLSYQDSLIGPGVDMNSTWNDHAFSLGNLKKRRGHQTESMRTHRLRDAGEFSSTLDTES